MTPTVVRVARAEADAERWRRRRRWRRGARGEATARAATSSATAWRRRSERKACAVITGSFGMGQQAAGGYAARGSQAAFDGRHCIPLSDAQKSDEGQTSRGRPGLGLINPSRWVDGALIARHEAHAVPIHGCTQRIDSSACTCTALSRDRHHSIQNH